jgi:hypothetical protein
VTTPEAHEGMVSKQDVFRVSKEDVISCTEEKYELIGFFAKEL